MDREAENTVNIGIIGLPGEGSQPDTMRIYLTPELDTFLEVPKHAIIQGEDPDTSTSIPTSRNQIGGRLFWLKKGANIDYTPSGNSPTQKVTLDPQAEFLQGEIIRDALEEQRLSAMANVWKRAQKDQHEQFRLEAATTPECESAPSGCPDQPPPPTPKCEEIGLDFSGILGNPQS